MWDWDIVNKSLYLSPRSCELFGLPVGSSPLGDWQHLLAAEDRAAVHAALVQHLRGTTERLDITYRLARPVNGVSWVHAGGRALRDAEGRATRLVGVLRDVSEQVARETRLLQAGVMFDCTSRAC
ncbi:PAS domain-containing protein [Halopseudomonas pachastrellae]|nr:PAS domain-containing protein [Halopseudomonas pachastrellae]